MANKLISQLGATASVVATDVFEIEKLAGPPSQKATITQLTTLLSTIYAPITGGAYVLKAGDTMTGLLTIAQATANTSALASTGYSLTGANAQSLMSLAGTWNTTGNPVALRLAITNTAAGGTSKLIEILAGAAGATSMFSLSPAGLLTLAGGIFVGTTSTITWGNRGGLLFSSDGVMRLLDNLNTDFGRLQFGGTTSAFPAIKRNAAAIDFRLADDSAPCGITALSFNSSSGALVSSLIVSPGDIRAASVNAIFWNLQSKMWSPSDGVIRFSDFAGTSFNRLQFGGTTSSFPSIKRNAAELQVRLADDSAFGDLSLLNTRTNNAAALAISTVAMTSGPGAALGTLTDAPSAGNADVWCPIVLNGVTHWFPCWAL